MIYLLGILCLVSVTIALPVLPNPPTLPDSIAAAPQDTEIHTNIQYAATDSAPLKDKNDNEEVKKDIVKIVSVVIPPPPQLPPFDYSILRKQKADQKLKNEESKKQQVENSIKEKEFVNLEKPIEVEVPTNPTILSGSVAAIQNLEVGTNTLSVATDSPPLTDKKDDEEVKNNVDKIALVVIPPPPELPPFEYSSLSENFVKQETAKSKKEEEKPAKVSPNQETLSDSVAASPDSEVRMDILKVASGAVPLEEKENKEVHNAVDKITSVVIPPPPVLPPLDYSILKKQKAEQKQKFDEFVKQEAEKSKNEKELLILEKPVEIKHEEEPKLVEESKPNEESKPVEESKPIDEIKKEPVKPSEDMPVIIQWTIPSAPFLSKLISNYPSLPNFGLNWPFQRPAIPRRPRIIYPKFDLDGVIYTN